MLIGIITMFIHNRFKSSIVIGLITLSFLNVNISTAGRGSIGMMSSHSSLSLLGDFLKTNKKSIQYYLACCCSFASAGGMAYCYRQILKLDAQYENGLAHAWANRATMAEDLRCYSQQEEKKKTKYWLSSLGFACIGIGAPIAYLYYE